MTLQEIESKILEYQTMKENAISKMNELVDFVEFKRSQNATDSVEVQNINDTINGLKGIINLADREIEKLEEMKKSYCEKRAERSKLWSNFYGY